VRVEQVELANRRLRMLAIAANRSTTSCFLAPSVDARDRPSERPEQWPTRSKRDLANFWQNGFLWQFSRRGEAL